MLILELGDGAVLELDLVNALKDKRKILSNKASAYAFNERTPKKTTTVTTTQALPEGQTL